MKVLVPDNVKIKVLCADNCTVKVKVAEAQKPVKINVLPNGQVQINTLRSEFETDKVIQDQRITDLENRPHHSWNLGQW